jgi:peptide/nickel transport system permease protein
MRRFIARRLVHLLMLTATIGALSFAIGSWAPGTFDAPLRLEPGYSPDAVAALRARHGLDQPFGTRFAWWLRSMARGDLGVSVEYDAPVGPLVALRACRTLLLGLVATSLAWLVAVPAGIWMAARTGSVVDRAWRALFAVLLTLPEPLLAIAFVMVAARTGLVPSGGMLSSRSAPGSAWTDAADVARHVVLPAVVLALGSMPVIARHVRSSVAAVLGAPFITAARARGVPAGRLLFRSALRAAASPLLSLLGLSVGSLLSASLIVEVVTGWPGLGPLLVDATRSRDVPVVAAVTLCSTLLLGVGGGMADLATHVADPRTRAAAPGAR